MLRRSFFVCFWAPTSPRLCPPQHSSSSSSIRRFAKRKPLAAAAKPLQVPAVFVDLKTRHDTQLEQQQLRKQQQEENRDVSAVQVVPEDQLLASEAQDTALSVASSLRQQAAQIQKDIDAGEYQYIFEIKSSSGENTTTTTTTTKVFRLLCEIPVELRAAACRFEAISKMTNVDAIAEESASVLVLSHQYNERVSTIRQFVQTHSMDSLVSEFEEDAKSFAPATTTATEDVSKWGDYLDSLLDRTIGVPLRPIKKRFFDDNDNKK